MHVDAPPETAESLARTLNPEAGSHVVTNDPRELAAVEAASARSFAAFPYYGLRYGERGQRFGTSDGAWLAALAREPAERVVAQVAWLGGVLSARGMPRRLLEVHLAFLAEELDRAVPERSAEHERLAAAAAQLARARAAHVDDAALRELGATFEADVGERWRAPLRGTGEILASAVADERCGLLRAVPSVAGWFREPGRFPAEVVAAVEDAVERARRLAATRGPPQKPGR